jgi:hypothetical protein
LPLLRLYQRAQMDTADPWTASFVI